MRRGHLARLGPVCPACRAPGDDAAPLALGVVAREAGDDVLEGSLACGRCRSEYPILDGVPIVLPDLATFLRGNAALLLERDDLSPEVEALLGDGFGAQSSFDVFRQHVSSYAWDHWADLDPGEPPPSGESAPSSDPAPGGLRRLLARGLALAGDGPAGAAIDVGCGPGRGLWELAARDDVELVLGVDLHVPMLRLASRVLRTGRVRYARKDVGLIHSRRDFEARLPGREKIDTWCCDATALPFRRGTFALATALNLVDSVKAPLSAIGAMSHVLVEGGRAVLSSPYDWASTATPQEAWIGGQRERGPLRGDSAALLRTALSPSGHPGAQGLELVGEADGLPWAVRMHARSAMLYRCHVVAAKVRPPAG